VSAGPAAPGPRLVHDADAPGARNQPAPHRTPPTRRAWLLALLVAVALLAAFEWRRAAALESRVRALSEALATAQAELTARREQIGAIRASVDDMRTRVEGLAALAAEEPTARPSPPAEAAPAH
jgi:cell division protein FtsB